MNGFVRHHEALADVGLGPCSGLVRSKLDFTDDKTGGVSRRWRRGGGRWRREGRWRRGDRWRREGSKKRRQQGRRAPISSCQCILQLRKQIVQVWDTVACVVTAESNTYFFSIFSSGLSASMAM